MLDKAKGTPKYDSWSQQYALIKAIGFTYDDLDANRGGYMSKKQRAALSKERQFLLYTITIGVVGIAILYAIILLRNVIEGREISYNIVLIAFIFFVPVLGFLFTWFKRNQLNADLYKGTVYVVEGVISLHVKRLGDYGFIMTMRNDRNQAIYYDLYIQDEKFRVEKPVFEAFVDGEPYAIYYTPHSKTILSAEWLREDD
jgi:hypothetical protein